MNSLLKVEIFLLISSLTYMVYYIGDYFFSIITRVREIAGYSRKKNIKEDNKEIKNNKDKIIFDKKQTEKENEAEILTTEDKIRISDIIKRVKINTEKGYLEKAKSLIVEGLTLDKLNKDLNLELGNIYESEKKYRNAELIYRDLLKISNDNSFILSKLGYALSMQGNYKEAIKVYEKILEKIPGDEEAIEYLVNLSFEVKDFDKSLKYSKKALRIKPKNVELLKIKAISLEENKGYKEALAVYDEILFLKPYDEEAIENSKKLEKYMID